MTKLKTLEIISCKRNIIFHFKVHVVYEVIRVFVNLRLCLISCSNLFVNLVLVIIFFTFLIGLRILNCIVMDYVGLELLSGDPQT